MRITRIAHSNDARWLQPKIVETWGSQHIALRGELIDTAICPALVCEERSGFLVYRVTGATLIEIVALQSLQVRQGIAARLVDAPCSVAKESGAESISATTTNDNLAALGFYQKRGFRLFELRKGEVDRARQSLKPDIPEFGQNGVPIHDEIELRIVLHHA